jgi:SpoVK/Ycf46/Vps4 family AAA+-type ATPase
MQDTQLLFDAFNIYYQDGMDALSENKFEVAKRNILLAAQTMLKLAKASTGELKKQRLSRADELADLAHRIDEKAVSPSSSAASDLAKFAKDGSDSSKPRQVSADEKPTQVFVPAEKTGIRLDDVAGMKEAKDEIKRKIVDPMKYPELYKSFRKTKGGGILLYGVPGTGKTMLAQAVANEIDAKFFQIKCSDIMSKWVGDSEQNVRNLFLEARKYPVSIIFFDEFEAIGSKRDTDSTVMKRVVPELLAQMQGFEKSDSTILLIAATNRPWDIDSAFLRPGRFNDRIYVSLPDQEARKTIISKALAGIPADTTVSIDDIVSKTDGFNGADVVEFCETLKDFAISRSIELGHESPINGDDVTKAAMKVKTSVQRTDLEKMAKYQSEYLN